jgi:hypothetical protein
MIPPTPTLTLTHSTHSHSLSTLTHSTHSHSLYSLSLTLLTLTHSPLSLTLLTLTHSVGVGGTVLKSGDPSRSLALHP